MACLMLRPRALPSGGGTAFPTWSKVEKPNQSARLSISYTLCCQRHKRRVALFLKITCCRTPKASSQENKEYGCPAISFRPCLFLAVSQVPNPGPTRGLASTWSFSLTCCSSRLGCHINSGWRDLPNFPLLRWAFYLLSEASNYQQLCFLG